METKFTLEIRKWNEFIDAFEYGSDRYKRVVALKHWAIAEFGKPKFPRGRPLTEEEVQDLRKRYKAYCEEHNTDGLGEFKLKE